MLKGRPSYCYSVSWVERSILLSTESRMSSDCYPWKGRMSNVIHKKKDPICYRIPPSKKGPKSCCHQQKGRV